jgi:hypothetical protein
MNDLFVIKLQNCNDVCIVDADYGPLLNRHKWLKGTHGYAASGKGFLMHRLITGVTNGTDVEHKNKYRLDNTDRNLVVLDRSNNLHLNSKRDGTKSIYKGVSYDKTRRLWFSVIRRNDKAKFLGRFFYEHEAALAYNKAAKEIYGDNAYQNDVVIPE